MKVKFFVFFGMHFCCATKISYPLGQNKKTSVFLRRHKTVVFTVFGDDKQKNIAKKPPYRWEPWKQKTTFEVILSDGDPDNYKMNRTVKLSWENQLFGNQLKVISKLPKPSRSRAEAEPKPGRSRAGEKAEPEPKPKPSQPDGGSCGETALVFFWIVFAFFKKCVFATVPFWVPASDLLR